MTTEQMIDAVANKFGLEDERTIFFAGFAECATLSVENLKSIFEQTMAKPIFSDEI